MPSSHASEEQARPAEETAPGQAAPGQNGHEAELAELRDENARLDDRYKRALADLDNYRKRSVREADRRVQESREAMLRRWLEAVDSVERALQYDVPPVNPVAEGLRAVLEQMEAILDREGVTREGAVGQEFDPERHEAVAVRETDEVPDRTILEVARSGYMLDDRVLRPAQVVVSRAPRDGDG
jgi:molecular chaperone GrpE